MRLNGQTLTEPFRDGVVVLDLATLAYYEFDRMGAAMWEALRDTGSLAEAHERLRDRFDVHPDVLMKDLDAFLAGLADVGLASLGDSDAPDVASAAQDNPPIPPAQSPADRYLELLIRSLTGVLNRDNSGATEFHLGLRAQGRDMSQSAQTLVGLARLRNIRDLAQQAIRDGVAGDFVEAGVWRGGSTILMRGVLAAHGITDRDVWVADSFAGLPDINAIDYPMDSELERLSGQLVVSQTEVCAAFDRHDLLDDQVRFLPGLFADTLPTAPIDQIAVLRLDGDYYESTMDTLVHLYPKVSPGGFVIIDDWWLAPCRTAVQDYLREHAIQADIIPIDWAGAWFRTPAHPTPY